MKTFREFLIENKFAKRSKIAKHVKMFIGKLHKHDPSEKKSPKKHFIGKTSKHDPSKLEEKFDRLSNLAGKTLDKKIAAFHEAHHKTKLNTKESLAVRDYTRDSKEINTAAYNGDSHESHEGLDSAIKKHKAPINTHVFSGMRPPVEGKHPSNHVDVHLPAYTSTSLSPRIGKGFSKTDVNDKRGEHTYWRGATRDGIKEGDKFDPKNKKHQEWINKNVATGEPNFHAYTHMAKIHIPEGSHGMYAEHHTPMFFKGEHEYLLHRNSRVRFRTTPTVDHESGLVIWHGHLTHDGVAPTRHGDPEPHQGDLFK